MGITASAWRVLSSPKREFSVSARPLSNADCEASPLLNGGSTPSRTREGTVPDVLCLQSLSPRMASKAAEAKTASAMVVSIARSHATVLGEEMT